MCGGCYGLCGWLITGHCCRVWNALRCVVLKVLPFSQMRLLIDSHFSNTCEMELRPNAASGILAIWTSNGVCCKT